MFNVKLNSTEDVQKILEHLPNGSNVQGNFIFHINDNAQDCDFWVILHDYKYSGKALCSPDNVIFVTGEPPNVKKYSKKFLDQFGTVITSQDNIQHNHVIVDHQLLSWTFNKTYDELAAIQPFKKTKTISVVTSNKRFSREHEQRYQFARAVKSKLGNCIDLYGRGIHNFEDKWDVLAPYKYSIAIENVKSSHCITEKLTECFLSYTFPLYYGCTNAEDYYPKGSYEWIDISDLDGSLELIERITTDSNYYQKHLPALCKARKLYLEQYDCYPLLIRTLTTISSREPDSDKMECIIRPEHITASDLSFKGRCFESIVKNKIDALFMK